MNIRTQLRRAITEEPATRNARASSESGLRKPGPRWRGSRAVAAILLTAVVLAGSFDLLAATRHKKKKSRKAHAVPCRSGCAPQYVALDMSGAPEEEAAERELSALARELHDAVPGSDEKLSAFAAKNSSNVWGARAALALGFDDYNKNHAPQALAWFTKAKSDALLGDYVLYWTAQTQRLMKNNAAALANLVAVDRDYPGTPMREQLLEALAPAATDAGHPQVAIDALETYGATASKPALLLLRAQAYQAARQFARAAKDYQVLFYKYPLADEAEAAGSSLPRIMHILGKEYAYPGPEMQQERAQAFFDAHKWKEARAEFEKLLTMLRDSANPHRQLAQLRLAQARIELRGPVSLVSNLDTPDAAVDAERLYVLSQLYRSGKKEAEMLSTIETLARKYPQSQWTESGIMAAGNYYWVELDRDKAVSYYQRLLDNFPSGRDAYNAEWRVAWVAYLERQPYADDKLTVFLRKYPVSANAPDAVYWLGRDAERGGNPGHARSFYRAAIERFPETYFAHAAAARLDKLGAGQEDDPEFLAAIPPPPALRAFDEPVPQAAMDRWQRAQALRAIAFDSGAELELKSAYFSTGAPRLLFEAAQAAFAQGHFGTGMAYARAIVPSFDSRRFSDLPLNVWKTLYPLPYEAALRREAARDDFDPMLAAGLIRQESTFQADAVSHKDAIGLMQVLPKTGRRLARQLRIRYTKNSLFEPDYNIEVGMLYISSLLRATGAPEYALAAFNAGEDRIAAWRAERNYEEVAELVESIPFSETREYVQIVLRNAEVYRMIYGAAPPSPGATTTAATSEHRAAARR